MVEPFTLAALGGAAANEGIKFLYGQAAEVLKRWRDRKAGKEAAEQACVPVDPATSEKLLAGALETPTIDFAALERLHDVIKESAGMLGNYVGGLEEPDPDEAQLSQVVDTLRSALEAVYGQRITFKGEDRPPSGPVVISRVEVDEIAGRVTGVRAERITRGRVDSGMRLTRVEQSADVVGVEADTIG